MDLFELLGKVSINNADANKALDDISEKGQEAESKLSKAFGAIGKGAAVVGKAVGAGLVAAGGAVVGLVTKATGAYAEYEQLVGGVETLFGDSAAKVMAYAEGAYETAGMSANEYMTTVTSFSASLLQSLGGDTDKAAEKANVAITDMSDNANKMGTSMEMIQNAYNGFAKQNYTMLDNLKLGYGGTKEEMQRLLDDAEKLSGQKFDLSSYADVVDAIHVIQTEMGITGTTAAESAGTISGSMSSVKGAWQNLVTAMASDDLPLDEYIDKFVNSATVMVSNMLPRIQKALGGVVQLVNELAPVIIGKIPEMFSELLPSIIEAAVGLVDAIVGILPDLIDAILEMAPTLIDGIVQILNTLIPALVEILATSLETLLPALIDGLLKLVIALCNNFAEILQPLIDALPDIIINVIDALMTNLPALIQGAITLVMALVNALPVILQSLVDALPMIFDMLIAGLMAALPVLLKGLGQLVMDVVRALPKILSSLIEAVLKILMGVWNGIVKIFSGAGAWFGNLFRDAWNNIAKAFSGAGAWFSGVWNNVKSVFSNVGSWFSEKFTDAWNKIKKVFSGVGTFFGGIWTTIKDKFSAIGTQISESISGAVKTGINNLIGSAENIINGFFGLINGAIDIINEIPGVNITKIKLVEFTRLAKGGVVDEPTPAIFGEDGAEAVVPLENNTGWIDKIATRLHQLTSQQSGSLDNSMSVRMVELQQMQVSELQGMRGLLGKILEAIVAMDENMGGNLRDALDGLSFDVNKREFARLVKESV